MNILNYLMNMKLESQYEKRVVQMTKYVKDNEWGTVFPNFRKDEFKC